MSRPLGLQLAQLLMLPQKCSPICIITLMFQDKDSASLG